MLLQFMRYFRLMKKLIFQYSKPSLTSNHDDDFSEYHWGILQNRNNGSETFEMRTLGMEVRGLHGIQNEIVFVSIEKFKRVSIHLFSCFLKYYKSVWKWMTKEERDPCLVLVTNLESTDTAYTSLRFKCGMELLKCQEEQLRVLCVVLQGPESRRGKYQCESVVGDNSLG
jgi:hypothetical protein